MKKLYVLVFAALAAFLATSCKEDFDPNYPAGQYRV